MLRSHPTAGSCWRGCMEQTPKHTRNEPSPPHLQRGTAKVFQGSADTSKQLRDQPCLIPGSCSSGTTTSSSGSSILMGDSSARAALPTLRHMEQQGNHPEKQHHQKNTSLKYRTPFLLWNQTQIYCKKHGIRGKKSKTVPDPPN